MNSPRASPPWVESAVLGAALFALVVAGAIAADLPSVAVWGLVTLLCALYILSRGAARGTWSLPDGRPAAPAPVPAPEPEPEPAPPPRAPEPAPAPARTGETAAEVTLSEERLKVTSRPKPRERVQVRKEIVTEEVTITVPVRHERLRIERVPLDAPEHPDAELDVTLMDHEPVVAKEIVPTERVRLERDVVTHREPVSAPVRREQVEFERSGPQDPREGAR